VYSLTKTVAIESKVKKDSERINGTMVARVILESVNKPMAAEMG
jgi:hypothetical protein